MSTNELFFEDSSVIQ